MAPRTVSAILIAVTLAGCAAAEPPATAEPATVARCARAPVLLKVLADDFGERPVASGVARGGDRMIVTASERGTWTLLAIFPRPQGEVACMVSSGSGWTVAVTGPRVTWKHVP